MAKTKKKTLNKGTILKKYLAGEYLYKYEEDYLWKKLRDECDKVFSEYIRLRDKKCDCISGGAENCKHKIQNACHRIPREWYSHRRDEDNVFGGCGSCNGFNKQEHQKFFTIAMIKKYGQEWVDKQLFEKDKYPPDIQDLLYMIDKYKKKSSIEKGK